jgi:AcrR family transcriptional regulator
MPRSPEQNLQLRRETRARILEAALIRFGRHGYHGTAVRRIAEDAGVSQGLLYTYFRSKEEVLVAIFQEVMAEVHESLSDAEAVGESDRAIESLTRSALDIVSKNASFWRLTYQLRMQEDVADGLGVLLSSWSEGIRTRIEAMLERIGIERPELEARVLFAAIDGAAQHYVLEPEEYPADAVAAAIARRFTGCR